MTIQNLPDDQLIESYQKAKDLELEPAFVEILWKELERRNLKMEWKKDSNT